MPTFPSKYDGTCRKCNGRYSVGDRIFWEPGSKAVHAGCSDYRPSITIEEDGDWLELSFPYDEQLVALVKSLPIRKYDSSFKTWRVPNTEETRRFLETGGAPIKEEKSVGEIELRKTLNVSEATTHKDYPFLFKHQAQIVNTAVSGKGKLYLGLPPGAGKSNSAAAAMDALDAYPLLIVGLAGIKVNWQRELKRFFGKDSQILESRTPYEITEDIVIINYDILDAWAPELRKKKFKGIIFDECFTGDTMVDTPTGQVPIDSVKTGDVVLNAAGSGEVISTSETRKRYLTVIRLEDGSVLRCSPNHPVFTGGGFVNAGDIKNGDYVYGTEEAVRMVRYGYFGERQEESILRSILLSEMESLPPGVDREDIHSGKDRQGCCCPESVLRNSGRRGTPEGSCREDGDQSTDSDRRNPCQSVESLEGNRPQAKRSGRKWKRFDSSGAGASRCFGGRGGVECDESYYPDWNWQQESGQSGASSESLQVGSGDPRTDDFDRGGRVLSQGHGEEGSGFEEDLVSRGSRVESVEIYQSGSYEFDQYSGGEDFIRMYNLQVSGHPSFSVEGKLVHNCSHIKSPEAKRTKAAEKVAKGVKNIMLLSGTPTPTSPYDLIPPLRILGELDKYGGKKAYVARYCPPVETRYGVSHSQYTNLSELHNNLKKTCFISWKKEDLIDLPALNVYDEYVEGKSLIINQLVRDMKEPSISEAYRVLKEHKDDEGAGQFSKMRAEAGTAKIKNIIEEASAVAESDKVIIGVHHRNVNDEVFKALSKKFKTKQIIGGMSADKRQEAIDSFQDGDTRILVMNIIAGGVGINLQNASHMILGELPVSYADQDQVISRIYRSGQKNKVTVKRMVSLGTIDDVLVHLIEKKKGLHNAVMAGESSVTTTDIMKEMAMYLVDQKEKKA